MAPNTSCQTNEQNEEQTMEMEAIGTSFLDNIRENYEGIDPDDIPNDYRKALERDFTVLTDYYLNFLSTNPKVMQEKEGTQELMEQIALTHSENIENTACQARLLYMSFSYPYQDQIDQYLSHLEQQANGIDKEEDRENFQKMTEYLSELNNLISVHYGNGYCEPDFNNIFTTSFFLICSILIEIQVAQIIPLYFLHRYYLTLLLDDVDEIEEKNNVFYLVFIHSYLFPKIDGSDLQIINDDNNPYYMRILRGSFLSFQDNFSDQEPDMNKKKLLDLFNRIKEDINCVLNKFDSDSDSDSDDDSNFVDSEN